MTNANDIKRFQLKLIDNIVDFLFIANPEQLSLLSLNKITKLNLSKNDTQYTLTLLYSGTESKRIVISSYDSQGVQLKSGSYRIVASVDARRVRNFAGKEDLTGGIYSVNYYISTSRY